MVVWCKLSTLKIFITSCFQIEKLKKSWGQTGFMESMQLKTELEHNMIQFHSMIKGIESITAVT